jgi:hypothetical protein
MSKKAASGLPILTFLSAAMGQNGTDGDEMAANVLGRLVEKLSAEHADAIVQSSQTAAPREWHARMFVDDLRQARLLGSSSSSPPPPSHVLSGPSRALSGAETSPALSSEDAVIRAALDSSSADSHAELIGALPPVLRERFLSMIGDDVAGMARENPDVEALQESNDLGDRYPNIANAIQRPD